jgi:hypothetical protein
MTPNARTRAHYRGLGYTCEIVEYWSPFPKPWGKRHDLLAMFDLIRLGADGMVGVQATADNGGHVANRVAKILASEHAPAWFAAGGKIVVIGWAKKGPRGKVKRWTCREVWITPDQLNQKENTNP